MSDAARPDPLSRRYEGAAQRWRDKMRALGYYDGYLGFLSARNRLRTGGSSVIDMGAGSAAFAEAWVAVNGAPDAMTLVDPSHGMLARGVAALAARNVTATPVVGFLGATDTLETADVVLAAHVVEHCPDPVVALRQLGALIAPGGRLWLVASKPHWCNAIIWLQWRHRCFSPDIMRGLLAEAGYEVEFEYAFPAGPPSRTSRGYVALLR
jgi:ubiquinone/menaquinone biosynthesis C-methylase UbiE